MLYLVEKYAKNDDLYPKDNFLLRTRINEVLFYEASYLYPRLYQITVFLLLDSPSPFELKKTRYLS